MLWDSSGTADVVFTFPHPLPGRQSPARGPCHRPFLLPKTQPDYKSEMLGYQKTRRFLGDLQHDPRAEELTHRGPGSDTSKLLGAEVQVGKQLAGTWSDYFMGLGEFFFSLRTNTNCPIPEQELRHRSQKGHGRRYVHKDQPNLLPARQELIWKRDNCWMQFRH